MDLSIATHNYVIENDGKVKDSDKNEHKLKPSGTIMQEVTVTNESHETVTNAVVRAEMPAGFDMRDPNQSMTEFGTPWMNPVPTSTTNGTVTMNDVSLAGMELKKMDLESMPGGELIWHLDEPLAPGESAMMTFESQISNEKPSGTKMAVVTEIIGADQTDVNPQNNLAVTNLKFGTPIALDLNGDGIQTISIDEGVEFDIFDQTLNIEH